MKIDARLSGTLNRARIAAILLVISAHISVPNPVVNKLLAVLGGMGVGIFLAISGYLYNTDRPMRDFISKKIKTLMLPWMISGTLVYAYTVLMKGEALSFSGLIGWILGYKTYLYFMTLLIIYFLIFYGVRRRWVYVVAIALNVVSVAFTQFGLLEPVVNSFHITNYLNPLNLVGFFAIGAICRSVDSGKLYERLYRFRYAGIVGFIVSVVVLYITGQSGYFKLLPHLLEYLVIFSVISFCTLGGSGAGWQKKAASYSFSIYLYHMPFVGLLARVYTLNVGTMVVAPVFVYAVTFLILFGMHKVFRLIKAEGFYKLFTGIR